jgi:hypothetical protein
MSDNHNTSNLRSLQASVKETSVLLNILQGTSGQAFAADNDGWDRSTPGKKKAYRRSWPFHVAVMKWCLNLFQMV